MIIVASVAAPGWQRGGGEALKFSWQQAGASTHCSAGAAAGRGQWCIYTESAPCLAVPGNNQCKVQPNFPTPPPPPPPPPPPSSLHHFILSRGHGTRSVTPTWWVDRSQHRTSRLLDVHLQHFISFSFPLFLWNILDHFYCAWSLLSWCVIMCTLISC